MLVLDVPVFLFQNLTFLNINISSHHYEYPSPILLKVSNESHCSLFLPVYEFAATEFLCELGFLSIAFPGTLSRLLVHVTWRFD